MRIVEVDPRLDLFLLMYPSFALPMFSVSKDRLEKLWGVCEGLKVRRVRPGLLAIEHEDPWCRDYADEVLGLWSTPSSIRAVSGGYRGFVEALTEGYGWLGIATSSADDLDLFVSIYLSRNTDFHVNVVRWVRAIRTSYGSVEALLNASVESVAKNVGRSYQVVQLVQVLRDYLTVREYVKRCDIDEAKRLLLRVRGLGPKSFHAYALYVRRLTEFAPIDKNIVQFLKRFETTSELVAEAPRKDMCLRYTCDACSLGKMCTFSRLRRAFGKLSGWVQTVAYLHNKLVCRYSLCKSCFLKTMCRAPVTKA